MKSKSMLLIIGLGIIFLTLMFSIETVFALEDVTILRGHTAQVTDVAFNQNGSLLASASADRTIRLWTVSTGEELAKLRGHTDVVNSVAFRHHTSIGPIFPNPLIASGSDDETVRLWIVDTDGKWVNWKTFDEHSGWVTSVAFSPDGNTLASASNDGTIRLWSTSDWRTREILRGHRGAVTSIAFSGDGSTLASASTDQTIRLWAVDTGNHRKTIIGHANFVWSVAFSGDGRLLASGSFDNLIRLWDAETGEHEKPLVGHTGLVLDVAFSGNGDLLASCSSDRTIRLWDDGTGEHWDPLTGHTDIVYSVALNNDGSLLASGSFDRTVRLWKLDPSTHTRTDVQPDLVVESLTPNEIILEPGERFTLTARLKNEGNGLADAPIRYRLHRATQPDIHNMHGADRVLTGAIEEIIESYTLVSETALPGIGHPPIPLPPEYSTSRDIDIIAPEEPGIYYYSVCVNSIENESDIHNNCSTDIKVIVHPLRIRIPDSNLLTVIEAELGKKSGSAITATDMRTIKVLNAANKGITELTGLEFAINLVELDLSNNEIKEVDPLAGLTNLVELDLSNNEIKEVDPLAGLTNLEALHLDNNEIKGSNMSPLAGLINLTLHFNKPYKTINEFGSTVYNYNDGTGNKTVLIKGLELDNPNFKDSNLDYTDYLPPETGNYFKIYKQKGDTCGHYSAMMLLHYYGVKFTSTDVGKITFDQLTGNSIHDLTTPSEMKSGLSKSMPVEISNDAVDPDNNPDTVLRSTVSQSRPPIIFTRQQSIYYHWVIVVGYDTKTNKFLIADPNGFFYWNDYDAWTDTQNSDGRTICRPPLKDMWRLDPDPPPNQNTCILAGSIPPIHLASEFVEWTQRPYQMFVPTVAPPYHHLESITIPINIEGKSNLNALAKSDFKEEYPNIGNVEHCAWFFVKKDEVDEFAVQCQEDKVVVSGKIGDGWHNLDIDSLNIHTGIGMLKMFLTVYYEPGGGTPAPSIILSAPSISTSLLPNYPNPFNPETWIPYQLANPADVALTIYDINGRVVRDLDLGHQRAGMYQSRARAAHWDGKNEFGEAVASGVYFYTLKAGDFSATRKMLIRK